MRPDILLEAVVAQEQIGLAFQPQIECRTGKIVGVEALARWAGAPSADKLFERAAAAGIAERLSRLAQRRALRIAGAWEGPLRGMPIAINLLPQEIARAGYETWLLEQIHIAGIDPRRVTVELTESALLADQAAAADRLARLRDAGLGVALDDFGTGYASLAYLVTLPIDTLKIDRGLIAGISKSNRSRIIVRSTIEMARELGLTVLVEGVESDVELEMLTAWGCDRYQGFLGSRALEQSELATFVASAVGTQAA